MPFISDEGFVLKIKAHRESDLLVTLFLKEKGKITALARSAKRSKRRFGGLLMPFHLLSVQCKEDSRSHLIALSEASMIKSFSEITLSLSRVTHATYILDLLINLTEDHSPNKKLYDHILESLTQLETSNDVEPIIRRFEWNCLIDIGYRPELINCIECKRKRPNQQGAIFYFPRGGIICRNCSTNNHNGIKLSAKTINQLISNGNLTDEETKNELKLFLPKFITYQLGKTLPSTNMLSLS